MIPTIGPFKTTRFPEGGSQGSPLANCCRAPLVARDIEAYERFFFEKLSRLPGVQEINSIVALSEIKSTTALPLDLMP